MAFGHSPHPRRLFTALESNFTPRGIGVKTKIPDNIQRNPVRDSLNVFNVDATCETARGQTRLFFSGISDGFVHGPDMLIPMVNLTERLLETDERIVLVREVQFRKLVRTELALTVKPADQIATKDTRDAAVFAKFSTNKKRTLVVLATPVPEKIEGGMWVGQAKRCEDTFGNGGSILITEDEIEMIWSLRACPPFSDDEKNSTAIQLANIFELTLQVGASVIENHITSDRNLFAAGCSRLSIPDLTQVDQGSTISVTIKDPLRVKTNFKFAAFKMHLKNARGKTLSEGVVEIAMPNTREALIKAHQTGIEHMRMYP